MGRPHMPWQQFVADVAGEIDVDGQLAYDTIVLVGVGRQGGKTELKDNAAVHRSTAMVPTHGPQLSTFTMQTRDKARQKLQELSRKLAGAPRSFREVTNPKRRPTQLTEWKLSLNNGSEHIQFGPATMLKIDAPTRTGGHGDSLDLGQIDEAFAHQDDAIETAMEPAMATRRDAQLWVISSAGDERSTYLWRKVLAGRAACEAFAAGDREAFGRTAYFEWSAPDELDPGDRRTWWAACPALGFTIGERFLASKWEKALMGGREGIDRFRRSYLSQWPEVPVLNDELGWRHVPEELWTLLTEPKHRARGRIRYGLDVDVNAHGEEWASIGCSDGRHLELGTPEDAGPGIDWVVPTLAAQRDVVGQVWIDPRGPAGKLVPALKRAKVGLHLATPQEMVQASMLWLDAVKGGEVRHVGQAPLTRAVGGVATKAVGDGQWRWSRSQSAVDIGPLWAVTLAWAATALPSAGPAAKPERANSGPPTGRTDTSDLASMPF